VPLARPSLQAWTTEVLEAGVRLDTVDRSEAAAKCSRADDGMVGRTRGGA
jgi:hypothetical protein